MGSNDTYSVVRQPFLYSIVCHTLTFVAPTTPKRNSCLYLLCTYTLLRMHSAWVSQWCPPWFCFIAWIVCSSCKICFSSWASETKLLRGMHTYIHSMNGSQHDYSWRTVLPNCVKLFLFASQQSDFLLALILGLVGGPYPLILGESIRLLTTVSKQLEVMHILSFTIIYAYYSCSTLVWSVETFLLNVSSWSPSTVDVCFRLYKWKQVPPIQYTNPHKLSLDTKRVGMFTQSTVNLSKFSWLNANCLCSFMVCSSRELVELSSSTVCCFFSSSWLL